MYKIDLKNAYWSVPVLLTDKKWLKFQRKGVTYQFRVWPLGLGPVPRWFTKLMKPVIRLLCRMEIRNVIYMDNLWGEEQGLHEKAALQAMITVKLLESLGFVINLEKSILEPTRTLTDYLGFIVDSINMTLALPPNKVKKVQSACQNLLAQERVTVREVATASPRASDSKRSGESAESVSSDVKGSVSSSTALPELADNANSVTPEKSEKVRGTDHLDLRMQKRAQMVDRCAFHNVLLTGSWPSLPSSTTNRRRYLYSS